MGWTFGICLAFLAYCSFTAPDQDELDDIACGSSMDAWAAAEAPVRAALQAPSTADFPMLPDRTMQFTPLGDCSFRISSYVDAQNGFGAVVRERYVITMSYDRGTHRWVSRGLTFQ